MSLHKKMDIILRMEKEHELEKLKINNIDIWPYVKNKIFGVIVNIENQGRRNRSGFTPVRRVFDKSKQAANINKEYDVLVFNFYRFEIDDEYTIYDSRNYNLIQELEKQDVNYAQIVSYHEGQFVQNIYEDDNIYIMDELYYLNTLKHKNRKYQKNYNSRQISKIIKDELDIDFQIEDFELEFLKNIEYFHSYIKKVLLSAKPKAIFINANVVRPYLVSVAKDLGILVYEVQYAAMLPYHLGYDLHSKEYKFSPDGLFVWGEYWKKMPFLSKTIKDVQVIGFDRKKEKKIKKIIEEKSILIVSQDLFSQRFINEAKEFCKAYPDWKVYYKKHPAEQIDFQVEFSQFSNLYFEKRNIEDINTVYSFVVGINSTALFEFANMGNKIIILRDIMSEYMRNLIDEKKAFEVETLVNNFEQINNYDYYNKDEFFEYESKVSFDKILNHEVNFEIKENDYLLNCYQENMRRLQKLNKRNDSLLYIENLIDFVNNVNEDIITLVIPCYNVETKIKRNIASIKRNMLFKNMQIILINDASTDNTLGVLNSLKEDNIKVINNTSSTKTPSTPRNIGLEQVKTKYTYFLDSDDYMYDNTLDKVVYFLEKTGVDFVKTGCLINNSGDIGAMNVQNKYHKNIPHLLKTNIFVYTHVFKTSLLLDNKVKFIEKSYEDLPFMAQTYLHANKAITLEGYMTVYQKEKGTQSDVDTLQKFKDLIDQRIITKKAVKDFNDKNLNKEYYRKWMLKFIIEKVKINSFLSDMDSTEKEEYNKKIYNTIYGIEKYEKSFKGLNEENFKEKINEYKDSFEFKLVNFNVTKQGTLDFNLISDVIYDTSEYLFGDNIKLKEATSVSLDINNGEEKAYEIENITTKNKIRIADFPSIERANGVYKYSIKNEKNKLIIRKEKNKSFYYLIDKVYLKNGKFNVEISFSGSENEFSRNEYYFQNKRLLQKDVIEVEKNARILLVNKNSDEVGICVLNKIFYFNSMNIIVVSKDNEVFLRKKNKKLKALIKRILIKLGRKDQIAKIRKIF